MQLKQLCILTSFSILFSENPAHSQTGPQIPQIDTLSVVLAGPGTEAPFMVWNSFPGVDGYIIFHYEASGPNMIWYGIDTTYSWDDTTYLDLSGNPAAQAENYRIGVLDRSEEGNFSGAFGDIHSTIHCTADFDPCEGRVEAAWTPYRGWDEGIMEYIVYLSVDGLPYQQAGRIPAGDTVFVLAGVDAYREYCFRIGALSSAGRTSTSNTSCVVSDMPRPPGYINADYATVNDQGNISLSFHVDPLAETEIFKLLRKSAGQSQYDTIYTFPPGNTVVFSYTDEDAGTSVNRTYRLAALNQCGNTVALSNPAGNILLTLTASQFQHRLSWNRYREWAGGTSSYSLWRSAGGAAFEEIAFNAGTDTTYSDNVSSFRTQQLAGTFCYRVVAVEGPGNPWGITGESRSNTVCISLETDVVFPNAIVPNSEIPANRVFRPVFSFYPQDYYLVIYNRWNNKVFETTNPEIAWDGSLGGGEAPREGVYIFYCRLVGADGTVVEKNGQISVLFRK